MLPGVVIHAPATPLSMVPSKRLAFNASLYSTHPLAQDFVLMIQVSIQPCIRILSAKEDLLKGGDFCLTKWRPA